MEAVLKLKRSSDECMSYEVCIICQQKRSDKLFKGSEKGLSSLREATSACHKLRDTKYRDAIDRITSALDTDSEQKLVWHKTCFACYTDKGKIKRLHTSQVSGSEPSTSKEGQDKSDGGRTSLRSRSKPTDWELCVFCQKHEAKVKLSTVTTFKVSRDILN